MSDSERPPLVPPDLNDPRLAVPKRTEPPPWALPTWLTSTAGLLAGMAMVGGGTGLTALGREPGAARPVVRRRDVSRRQAWLEAIAIWGLVFAVVIGGRVWAGSWIAAAEVGGSVLLAPTGLFIVFAVPVLVIRLIRSGRASVTR